MNYLPNYSDDDLILNIKENNKLASDSILAIGERHGAIISNVVRKFSPILNSSGVAPADIYQERDSIIYSSALSYENNKGSKFTSWLYNQTRYLCLNTIKSENKKNNFSENQKLDYLNFNEQKDYQFEEKKLKYITTEINNISNDKGRKILKLRYEEKKTWKKISDIVGLSVTSVRSIHKRYIEKIKDKIKIVNE